MKKTLLLNSSYEALSFISEIKVLKFILKEKVDIIANWNDYIIWGNGKIQHPSILKLKMHVNIAAFKAQFSRGSLVKRDRGTCQYCYKKLKHSEITIDHVIPRAQGGKTSFLNCVISCNSCNNKKANKTPEEAKMPLIKKPIHPSFSNHCYLNYKYDLWNDEWDNYIFY